ncbi:nucleotidyl transferase [Malaciobacter canalis]|uniref:Nucleotidyl transferase n=1 Tax=Malaciobacter canalis TaxID=1912871 RepID=A0ABX4LRP9_9BACT|nr:nucleotidyltransferase family protein [Malaciobacter canalis]PHO10270.1 nucleotidyl transferase [Malaciobacter canalis]QEE32374.1 glucosamine-1-P guanylyltransferase [Malaciobacter canalis]
MKNLVLSEIATFNEAIQLLDSNGNGFLAITNDSNQLVGILTDGDIRRAILNNKTELSEIMNTVPMTMQEGKSRKNIILKLKELHRKHMPIVDENMVLKDVVVLDEEEFNLKPNWVVIMAGGLGTRLGELTKDTPKPMLKVGAKPMVEHIIDMFISHGFTKFMLSVNYKAEVIKEYFGDGNKFGIEVKYLEEKKRLGTGGALSLIDIELDAPFFVTNGDVLSSLDYEKLLEYHKEQNAIATMCIRKDNYQIPYGVIEVDEKNNIKAMKEKPIKEFFINTGIYVLNPEVLSYVPKNEFFDLPSLFDILKNESKSIKSFEITDYWIDMGKPSDYEKIQKDLSE